jgi:hypothetical protein
MMHDAGLFVLKGVLVMYYANVIKLCQEPTLTAVGSHTRISLPSLDTNSKRHALLISHTWFNASTSCPFSSVSYPSHLRPPLSAFCQQ